MIQIGVDTQRSWLTASPSWLDNHGTSFDMHLQWFAADDEGRTEEPTEHKIKKAREEGKVAKSQEVTGALVLLFAVVAIALMASYLLHDTIDLIKYFFGNATEIDIATNSTVTPVFLNFFLRMVLPITIICFITAVVGNVLQVGFLFTVKPITPDFNRIVPKFGKFLQKAFLSAEAGFNLLKSFLKVFIVVIIAFLNISAEIKEIAVLMKAPVGYSLGFFSGIAFRIFLQVAIAMLALSIPDYFFQRRQHLESLKMSKQEIKEERKTYEGDPLIKSRMRQRMRELLSRNVLKEVPKADVVITNPTHFSVALAWDRTKMISPSVLAKGVDQVAFKIREIANEHNIPLMENKPLARALYHEVEIGDSIPEKYWEVVALILAEVYKMSGKRAEAV
ncbi:MAG: flagellar biosynthesis protein FlhB [Spirochaetales bacterium]|nr:flagellar biosynthesis protein FlhB [Spirochaetales bacterium]